MDNNDDGVAVGNGDSGSGDGKVGRKQKNVQLPHAWNSSDSLDALAHGNVPRTGPMHVCVMPWKVCILCIIYECMW